MNIVSRIKFNGKIKRFEFRSWILFLYSPIVNYNQLADYQQIRATVSEFKVL